MFEDHNDSIYEILKKAPGVDATVLSDLNESFIQTGKSLANCAIDADLVTKEEMFEMIADYLDYDYETELPESIHSEMAKILSPAIALMYGVVPEAVTKTSVTFYAVDPFNSSERASTTCCVLMVSSLMRCSSTSVSSERLASLSLSCTALRAASIFASVKAFLSKSSSSTNPSSEVTGNGVLNV